MEHTKPIIIHVVQHLAPGGLESLALNMLSFSNPSQHTLIISLEGNKSEAIDRWPKLAQYKNNLIFLTKPKGKCLNTFIQLYRLFRHLKPHCVHSHHIGPFLYGAVAARLAKVPIRVHTEHDAWHLRSYKHRTLQKAALLISKPRLVADAKGVGDKLNEYFGYEDLTVIKNGVDCEHFKPGSASLARQSLKLPLDKHLIGTAGRLEHVKGQDILIQALPLTDAHIHLVIAGCGSRREQLEALSQSLGVAHRVTFLGLVEDMPTFYQALDLFCLPSRSEGFPLSTLEAQACGIRTIASDVGACEETLAPESGILFVSEDPCALAVAIDQALISPTTANPREFVLAQNDIRKMVLQYNTLTEEKYA